MSKRIFCASCLQISNLIPGTVLQFTKHWCINSSLLKLLSALLIYGFFPSFALPVFNSSQSKLKKIAAPLVLGDQLSDNRSSRVLLGSNSQSGSKLEIFHNSQMSKGGRMIHIFWPKCCTVLTFSCLYWICQQGVWKNISHAFRRSLKVRLQSITATTSSNMSSNLTFCWTVNKHLSRHQKSPTTQLPPSGLSKKIQPVLRCAFYINPNFSTWCKHCSTWKHYIRYPKLWHCCVGLSENWCFVVQYIYKSSLRHPIYRML